MKPVRLTRIAESEIKSAAAWHEQRSEGLDGKFLDRVNEAIDRIASNPQGYAVVESGARRCMVSRFPHALWFFIEPDESVVIGCVSTRRDRG